MPIQDLEELEQYLLSSLPQAKSIQQLRKNSQAGFLDFKWNGHHFAVKPSLEAFEIKDQRLFITGASMLVQAALSTRSSNDQTLKAVLNALDKAEDAMKTRPEEGLSLLGSVKATLARLIRRRS
jgi:hypothetical protein